MRKTILIVEDDVVVREMMKCALERQYIVFEAATYSEAINQLKNPVDLALIDYDLPDRDGFEVLNALREAIPALPAIIITAYSQEELVIKAIRAGVTDYIKKPMCLKYLRSKLSEIFGGNKVEEFPIVVESRDKFIMDGVSLYIKENYMKELPRKKIMNMAGMDRNKFSKLFKDRCGLTFKSYLKNMRVGNAVELLKNPDLSITEIASSVGYRSVQQFERVFKEEHGISPNEYRKKLNTEQPSQST